MYKIRNKTTGLFSTGGAYPRWTKRGKVWTATHHIRSHLKSNAEYKKNFYADAEVVSYLVIVDSTNPRVLEGIL